MQSIFDSHESEVRTYCRRFPATFTRAQGHVVWDETGREYIDFMSGAGALNYGHNHPRIKGALLDYVSRDGITHSLDLHTCAKREFIDAFVRVVLEPRKLDYKLQFTGPTGANAVEAAFKLARRVTGRTAIVAFTNGFHGMTLGALAASGTSKKRAGAGVPLTHVIRMPYDGYFGSSFDTIGWVERLLGDPGSGIDLPAAFVVETVQGEGGVIAASPEWLRRLQALAERRSILLIVDDIQAGCGRAGGFFSFEEAGLYPDIVCLSKSLSGGGLPFALMLMKRALDVQQPGEHSGTFRGNNLAFVTARAALSLWEDGEVQAVAPARAATVGARLDALAARHKGEGCSARGRGLLRGLAWNEPVVAEQISREAFESGLLVETSGAAGQVLKVMPPLTISEAGLERGLDVLSASIDAVVARGRPARAMNARTKACSAR